MYQPEGFKNPYILGVDGSGQEDILYEGFENGAKSMLKALIKEGYTLYDGSTMVIIPSEVCPPKNNHL